MRRDGVLTGVLHRLYSSLASDNSCFLLLNTSSLQPWPDIVDLLVSAFVHCSLLVSANRPACCAKHRKHTQCSEGSPEL